MRRYLPDLTNLRDRARGWWLCTRYGHDYTDRGDPPACRDCGRTQRGPR